MTPQTFNKFIEALSAYFAKKRVLVGSEIFDELSEYTSPYTFIKCDEIKDRVIVFGDSFPLACKAVTVDSIVAMHEMIKDIKYSIIASTHGDNDLTLIDIFFNTTTMMQMNDTEITFKQKIK